MGRCVDFNASSWTFQNCKYVYVCSECGLGYALVYCIKPDTVLLNRGIVVFRRPHGRGFSSFRTNYGRGC